MTCRRTLEAKLAFLMPVKRVLLVLAWPLLRWKQKGVVFISVEVHLVGL